MERKEKSIRQFLQDYNNGLTDYANDEGWHDWFCKDSSLRAKTDKLVAKLKQIAMSSKINLDTQYVWFKNNCPMNGKLYDDFRIADIETGNVVYTVVPRSGHTCDNGEAYLYGRENEFTEPLVKGTWKDIKKFFMEVK